MRRGAIIDLASILFIGLVLVLASVMAAGCNTLGGGVTSEFSETVDGVTTTYRAESKAGLFGELETSNHDFAYEYEGGRIAVGQQGQGYDNSGNVTALAIMAEALADVAKTRLEAEALAEAARARIEMEALMPPDPPAEGGEMWAPPSWAPQLPPLGLGGARE